MGGELQVTSVEGEGSCFSFNAQFMSKSIRGDKTKNIDQVLLSNIKVLVVDDNKIAMQVVLDVLTSFGISAKGDISGLAALESVDKADQIKEPFDLIIMDWKMPDLDGIESCKRITERSVRAIPFILMVSAFHKNEAITLANNTNIKQFIEKPLNASSLIDSINTLMSGTQEDNLQITALSKEVIIPDLSNYRLLLVEDNKINQQVAQGFLEETMVNVTIAENGSEALIRLEQEKFDCVLMDIQMPVMDGITATRKIRRIYTKKQLPIIAMTAHALQSDAQLSLVAGMNAHITKPIDSNVLYQTLTRLLNVKENLESDSKSMDYKILDSEKDILEKLNKIKELEIARSVYRLQNRVSLYLSLVEDFWRKNKSLPKKIERCLETGEHEKLFLIAHSLKSTAQYVGANRLAEFALALQESTKRQEIISCQVSDLLRELTVIINQLSPLFAKKERKGVDKPLNYISAISLINELRLLLMRAEAASENVSLSLNDLAENTEYETQIRHLHYLICDFEFESAIIELDNLERSLTGKSNG
jgi:CheY-like chemotaxis protein/HPt (histidine-containing phosphotransfer) domain-containing protein